MKKIINYFKNPNFAGYCQIFGASLLIGIFISHTTLSVGAQIIIGAILLFLISNGYRMIYTVSRDKYIQLLWKCVYDERIYGECSKGEHEFEIRIPNEIANEYTQHIGHGVPYFSDPGFKYAYIVADKKEEDEDYTTIIFTKIKKGE